MRQAVLARARTLPATAELDVRGLEDFVNAVGDPRPLLN
jgi:hypothetical protein